LRPRPSARHALARALAIAGALAPALLAAPAHAAPAWYGRDLPVLVAELGPVAQSGVSADPTGAELRSAESRVAALVIAAVAEDPADYAGIVGAAGAAAPGLRPGVESAAARAFPAFAMAAPAAPPDAPDTDVDGVSEDLAFEDILPPPDDDPFEGVNRFVFAIGDAVDTLVLKPLAAVYGFVTPGPVKEGMRRVVANLGAPADLANDLMQGEFSQGASTAGRFLVNSTVGLAGFFDVAEGWGMPPHDNDFGITLASYGAGPGPYVVLPVFGPSTTRDAVGEVVDTALDPLTWLLAGAPGYAVSGTKGVVKREEVSEELDQLRTGSLDYYVAVRSAFLQHRAAEVADHMTAVAGGEPAPSPSAAAAEDAFESFE
jgi:phospholipid-binding lipoprotein MlaA